jgi:hypothetical protein
MNRTTLIAEGIDEVVLSLPPHPDEPISTDPEPRLLIFIYPEGDVDLIKWPNPDRGKLARCLYDSIETGELQEGDRVVYLPDGTEFWIDQELIDSKKN